MLRQSTYSATSWRSRVSGLGLGLFPGPDDRGHLRGESGRRYLAPEAKPAPGKMSGSGPHPTRTRGRPSHREPARCPAAVACIAVGRLDHFTTVSEERS